MGKSLQLSRPQILKLISRVNFISPEWWKCQKTSDSCKLNNSCSALERKSVRLLQCSYVIWQSRAQFPLQDEFVLLAIPVSMVQVHFQTVHDIGNSQSWGAGDSCCTVHQHRSPRRHGYVWTHIVTVSRAGHRAAILAKAKHTANSIFENKNSIINI